MNKLTHRNKPRIQLSDHFTYARLLRFILPSAVMFIVMSVYSIVDGLFISLFAGKTAFAAVNFIMPFLMILGTPGFMLGTGGSALVSKTLGEGDKEKANSRFSMFVFAAVIIGVVIMVLAFIFTPQITHLLGASEAMFGDCVLYGRIIILGTVPQMLHFVFESFMVTAEKPEMGLKVTIASGVTNIVLDALFVGLFQWGVVGAAVATIISQFIGCLIPLLFFIRPNDSLLHISKTSFEAKAFWKACGNGSSELMSNISMNVVGMLYNVQLFRYLGEDGVAAYGIMMYVTMIFIGAFIGYAVGSAPIVGFHYGAKNHDELHNVLKKSLIILSFGGALMMLFGQVMAQPLSYIYAHYDANLYALTVHGFRIFSISFLLSGIAIFSSSFFTALNNGLVSAVMSFLRTLVFESACVMLLPLLLGQDGIWWSVVIAEIMAVVLDAVFLIGFKKKYQY